MDQAQHLKKLAEEIGARPAASLAEMEAAEYIAREMNAWCDEVAIEDFWAPRTLTWTYLVILLLGGLGGLAVFGNPMLGIGASLAAVVLYYTELTGKGTFWQVMKRHESRNVIGVMNPTGKPRGRVVLVAHHDSPKTVPGVSSGYRLRSIVSLVLWALVIMLFVSIGVAIFPVYGVMRYVNLVLGVLTLLAALYLLFREWFGRTTPGANDNASGIQALLEAGRRLAAERPRHLEVWCLSTGSHASGNLGMVNFLARHGREIRGDYFINLDSVGGDKLFYTLLEGLVKTYRADQVLLDLIREVGVENPELGLTEGLVDFTLTDAHPVMAHGFRAISIMSETGGDLQHWHSLDDRLEAVNLQTVEKAVQATVKLVSKLDLSRRP